MIRSELGEPRMAIEWPKGGSFQGGNSTVLVTKIADFLGVADFL
jgi:hypothetical protein